MRIIAIVQARTSSNRLPGKVLRCVAGKPLLQYLLERIGRCGCVERVVVATSTEAGDDDIADLCAALGVACHRGPLDNVAERFRQVIDIYPCDAFVRASGDSPLLDQGLIDLAVKAYRAGEFDLVTNVQQRTYPRGQSVEVVRSKTFRQACRRMIERQDREHVTRFFYRQADQFRIFNFRSPRDLSGIHMAVDEPSHLKMFAATVARMQKPHWLYSLDELVELHQAATPAPAEVSV